ncbi:expressed unknown protein [Seminavis robusta]|uniref:EGF-like domain-containing protein n=1 Tax=Seminavis robusta TaxID=568900 RepID=A0A9N8H4K2_9STRA|nr:expressed unknown protein [Seminavis robusta]|eukprot:Sro65_g036830.1 n/a (625) ;mRNA; r:93777-95806
MMKIVFSYLVLSSLWNVASSSDTPPCDRVCSNGGRCVFDLASHDDFFSSSSSSPTVMRCLCPTGWAGPHCDSLLVANHGQPTHQESGSLLESSSNNNHDDAKTGHSSYFSTTPCGSNSCLHGANCLLEAKGSRQQTCDCSTAHGGLFAGKSCEFPATDTCYRYDDDDEDAGAAFCVNGGTCKSYAHFQGDPIHPGCLCPPGWTGLYCEIYSSSAGDALALHGSEFVFDAADNNDGDDDDDDTWVTSTASHGTSTNVMSQEYYDHIIEMGSSHADTTHDDDDDDTVGFESSQSGQEINEGDDDDDDSLSNGSNEHDTGFEPSQSGQEFHEGDDDDDSGSLSNGGNDPGASHGSQFSFDDDTTDKPSTADKVDDDDDDNMDHQSGSQVGPSDDDQTDDSHHHSSNGGAVHSDDDDDSTPITPDHHGNDHHDSASGSGDKEDDYYSPTPDHGTGRDFDNGGGGDDDDVTVHPGNLVSDDDAANPDKPNTKSSGKAALNAFIALTLVVLGMTGLLFAWRKYMIWKLQRNLPNVDTPIWEQDTELEVYSDHPKYRSSPNNSSSDFMDRPFHSRFADSVMVSSFPSRDMEESTRPASMIGDPKPNFVGRGVENRDENDLDLDSSSGNNIC